MKRGKGEVPRPRVIVCRRMDPGTYATWQGQKESKSRMHVRSARWGNTSRAMLCLTCCALERILAL